MVPLLNRFRDILKAQNNKKEDMKVLTNVFRVVNTSELQSDSLGSPNRPEMLYIMNRALLWLVQQDLKYIFFLVVIGIALLFKMHTYS